MQINFACPTLDIDAHRMNGAVDNSERIVPEGPEYQNRGSAGRSHPADGPIDTTSLPHDPLSSLKSLLQNIKYSPESSLVVDSCAPRSTGTSYQFTTGISTRATRRRQIEAKAKLVRLKVAKVQLGAWYWRSDELPSQRRTFSIEYERDFLQNGLANIHLVYEHGLIRIDVSGNLQFSAMH
jgi:hypothetical protein